MHPIYVGGLDHQVRINRRDVGVDGTWGCTVVCERPFCRIDLDLTPLLPLAVAIFVADEHLDDQRRVGRRPILTTP